MHSIPISTIFLMSEYIPSQPFLFLSNAILLSESLTDFNPSPSMTDTQLLEHYTSLGWESFNDEGFMQIAGPFFFKTDGLQMHFLFPTSNKHKNLRGVVQGGALMTFTDRAYGAFARHATGIKATATIQFNYNFVDAVQLGDVVELSPVITKSTKSLIFLNGELTVGDRPVGFATGVWKRFD